MGLNPKQARFVAEYLKNSNATQAAKNAGYSEKTAYAQGSALLKHPEVSDALQKALASVQRGGIASRRRRQEFWTEVMEDSGAEMRDRLKAAELLGKSEADFTEKHEHAGPGGSALTLVLTRTA